MCCVYVSVVVLSIKSGIILNTCSWDYFKYMLSKLEFKPKDTEKKRQSFTLVWRVGGLKPHKSLILEKISLKVYKTWYPDQPFSG